MSDLTLSCVFHEQECDLKPNLSFITPSSKLTGSNCPSHKPPSLAMKVRRGSMASAGEVSASVSDDERRRAPALYRALVMGKERIEEGRRDATAIIADMRATIERDLKVPETREAALRSLPALLKRSALAAAPRREVASLVGAEWLSYLDAGLGGDDFSAGAGHDIAELAYLPPERLTGLTDERVGRLVALTKRWIRKGA